MNPFISVVIPLYNAVEYIHRAINSVLTQTYQNFEIIVVDDGSTDGSGGIVENIKDHRVRLIQQNNAGVSSARNRGIIEARGEYVAFLDADDEWDRIFLDAIVELIDLYPAAGIYSTGFRMVYSQGANVEVTIRESHHKTSRLVYDYFRKAARNAFIHTSGVVIPHHVFSEIGMFLVGVTHGEDLEMWARISLRYPIAYHSRILFNFYQTGTDGKPRYSILLTVDPVLTLLKKHIINIHDNISTDRDIKFYMSRYFCRMCLTFIRMNNRDGTIKYLEHNNMRLYWISSSMIKRMPFLWLGLRLFSFLMAMRHSRIMLRVIGGERKSHEIIQRLSVT